MSRHDSLGLDECPLAAPWPYPAVARRLAEERRRAGKTQAEMAAALGLSRPSIVNMEQGRQRIGLDHLYQAAALLGLNVVDLLPEPSPEGETVVRASVVRADHALARAEAIERVALTHADALERAAAKLRRMVSGEVEPLLDALHA